MKCPQHGALKTHGNVIVGTVVSDKAEKTAVITREYTVFLTKYQRSLRKHSKIHAYNPKCINARTGDVVEIQGTRRLSKTKSFVVTNILKKAA